MSVTVSAMPHRSPAVRLCWLLTALLQLGSPGAAAWADARLDVAGAGARPHIESHTTDACTRIHAPDCALCHLLTTPLTARRPATPRLQAADARRAPFQEPAWPQRTAHQTQPRSRAPPPRS